jgi:hypothetical protein
VTIIYPKGEPPKIMNSGFVLAESKGDAEKRVRKSIPKYYTECMGKIEIVIEEFGRGDGV